MKKTSIILGMVAMGLFASAQTRMSLYEEFTGENCGPCASTNPGLDALIASNSSKVIMIKWQVPIPSAPSATWSLYQTGKKFIDWRWRPASSNGYGYLCSTCSPTASYINYAPQGRMDGQELNTFGINQGGSTNHPGYLTAAAISSAQAQSTSFSISTIGTAWDATFDNCTVTFTVSTPNTGFTANGNLKCRVVLIERNVNFPSAPGSNNEKDFHEVIRQVYNTTPAVPTGTITDCGYPMAGTWNIGDAQTFSLNLAVPSWVYNKTQMAFVVFVQDDGDRQVWQAARSAQPSIPNEAQAVSVAVTSVVCSSTINPTATLKNNGSNAITDMTVTPYVNSVAGTPVVWTGNLAPSASTTIAMGVQNISNGLNTFSITITDVSGGDVVTSNNGASGNFFNVSSYAAVPVSEGFEAATFPPTGWAAFNPSGASREWERSTSASGFGTSSAAARNFINWTATGNYHDLYMPGTDLTGTVNPAIKFDYSYTMLNASSTDKMQVQVSTNCGSSWVDVWMNQGSTMATTPNNNSSLNIPTASQWSLVTVPLTSYTNTPIMVRFRLTAGAGNVFWLDNVNLYDMPTTGINEANNGVTSFDLYPNPAQNQVGLSIMAPEQMSGNINVINAIGQVVISNNVTIEKGYNKLQIDTKSLSNGIYYVVLDNDKAKVTKKLVIAK